MKRHQNVEWPVIARAGSPTGRALGHGVRLVLLHGMMAAAMLNLAAPRAESAPQLVEIGSFTAEGTIALQLGKFHEEFADGTRIAEIKLAQHKGLRVVQRKGYTASGDCRIESAPILGSDGQAIASHVVAAAGSRVFLPSVVKASLIGCTDDRCKDLAGVDGLDGAETISAKCDRTDLSENQCQCHVVTTESNGPRLVGEPGYLCKSGLERLLSVEVSDWIRFRYVG